MIFHTTDDALYVLVCCERDFVSLEERGNHKPDLRESQAFADT